MRAISRRAYSKWLTRVQSRNNSESDWFEAERELKVLAGATQHSSELEERLSRQLAASEIARQRLATEHDVGRHLTVASTLDEIIPRVLEIICSHMGFSAGVLWTVDGPAEVLRCSYVFELGAQDATPFAAATMLQTFGRGAGLAGQVWDSAVPISSRNSAAGDKSIRCGETSPTLADGVFAFPFRNGTEFLGVMEFFGRENVELEPEMVAMVTSISSQVAQFAERRKAEETIHREQGERELAGRIQQGFLPKRQPELPGYEICGRCKSAVDVGGDCFDFLPISVDETEALGILVADASGHRVRAALLVAEARAYVRALSKSNKGVDEMLSLVNEYLSANEDREGFVTALMVRLSPATGAIDYANAGHCPGIVFDPMGRVRAELSSTGLPLGIDPHCQFAAESVEPLEAGEVVLLFSDGIIEAWSSDGEMFGVERLIAEVQRNWSDSPEQLLTNLFGRIHEFSAGCPLKDDMTAVAIRRI